MKYKLKDIAEIVAGGTPSTKIDQYWNGEIAWITPKDLANHSGRYISIGERNITKQGLENSSAKLMPKNSVLFTSRAPIGYVAIAKNQICTNQGFKSLVCKNSICYYMYIYYWLIYNTDYIKSKANGSTFQEISTNVMKEIEIDLPSIDYQKKVANILKKIDEKIELNNQINDNLLEVIKTLYTEKIKNNNDTNFEYRTLDEFCNIFTGKKNANASEEKGKYKFFTCAPEPLNINSYIYDGPAVIVAGNGAYTGRTNFYNGKFDLYQRTYGITTNNDYIYLFYAMIYTDLQNDIMGGTHGSAIPYIVMNDIAKFKVKYHKEIFDELSQKVKVLLLEIKSNESENETLIQIRDTLLPKLMNGEIDLNNIEI